MTNDIYLITAAGGNGTAVKVIDAPLTRDEYAAQGKKLGTDMEPFGAEQAGFLIPAENHFEMGGGEFCGNASRSAALLLSDIQGKDRVSFTVSGYDGTVEATVRKNDSTHYFVECIFPGMQVNQRPVQLADGRDASVVDLGGIVHVILEESFPNDKTTYESMHRTITRELGFENRPAVGVVWIERGAGKVTMHPVVWVKDVDTFFYEQSCGSGTIAVAKVTDTPSITQPTGEKIEAFLKPEAIVLKSNMEITHNEHH